MDNPKKLKQDKGYIALNLKGKSDHSWANHGKSYFGRLAHLFNSVRQSQFFGKATVQDEAVSLLQGALNAAKEMLNKPAIDNAKKIAEIENIHADTELKKAAAMNAKGTKEYKRLIDFDSHERRRIEEDESIKEIEAMVKRGELIITETDGKMTLIVPPMKK